MKTRGRGALARPFVRVMLLLLLSLMVVLPRSVRADDVADEADLLFQMATERYEKGDFRTALAHFLASNRLVPNKNVVFNIARTYEQLKQAPDAYRYYLQALDAETEPAARKRIEDALQRIQPSVAVLRVETDPPGATVYLDRKDLGPRGSTPRSLGLAPGKYKVIVELAGFEATLVPEAEVTIGTESKVSIPLRRILGTVRVEGGPPGAVIRLDREDSAPLGTLPGSFAVPPGRHTLLVSKEGFASSATTVDVPVNDTVVARATLSAQTGTVVISADVRDALITVDTRPSGFTPAVLNLPVGRHRVRISQSGFRPFERVVDVTEGQQVRIEAQLTTFEEVTAASRTTEAVEDAPASVTIVTRQELRAMGYPTIAEAVRGIRGLYLSDDRSYVTIGVRGFSRPGDYGNRILVMVDGQPTNDNYIWSSYVGFDGRVDIEDIDRIEVVRGPGSVLYGTGAFFGVINLVTRDRSSPTYTELGVSAVEYGVGRARATQVVRFDEHSGFWASVAGAVGAGRDFYFPEFVADPRDPAAEVGGNGLPVDGNARGVDGFEAAMVNGRIWYKALTAQWFFNGRRKDLPTAEYETIFGDQRTQFVDNRAFLEVRFEPQVTKQLQLLSRVHANLYTFDDTLPYAPADGGVAHDEYRGLWGGFEQRVVFSPDDSTRLTFGAEVIRHFKTEQVGYDDTGPYLFDDDGNPGRNDPFTVAAAYALGDFVPVRWLKVSAGARLDYYSSLEKFEADAAINPRVALILKPYQRGNVKVLAGKAFRAPSVYELYYTSTTQEPPENLQPEQIYSGEVEFTHRFTNTIAGTVAAYANYVTDLVELRETPAGLDQYVNSSAPVLVLGSEYELRREWKEGWMVGVSYSLHKASYLDDDTLREVPNSPTHLGSLKGAVPILGRALSAMTRVSVEGPRFDRSDREGDPQQRETEAAVIWDLVLSGEAERLGVRYNLGVYNVANWRYDTVPSTEFRQRTIVQNGRTFLAAASVRF